MMAIEKQKSPTKMHAYPNGGGVLFIVMDTFELFQYLVIMV